MFQFFELLLKVTHTQQEEGGRGITNSMKQQIACNLLANLGDPGSATIIYFEYIDVKMRANA